MFLLFTLFSIFCLSECPLHAETSTYTPIENHALVPIYTPAFVNQKVEKIRLANGLEAYLISDPDTDQSGAVLSVRVGSWEDPIEYPGMAHFLEHLLFLGTKKYPEESGYQRFITEHGGIANAYTTHFYTSYMFSIENGAFEGALDRFSHFFKDPIFNPSGVARELRAIDQEYAKNLENDDMRLLYIDKQLANEQHPYHNFHIGNSKTLSKVSQTTLIDWYQKHYSANLMRLVVYSNLPIATLKEIVIADFKDVPTIGRSPYHPSEPLFPKVTSSQMVYIQPIKDARTLTLTWAIPSYITEKREAHTARLLCYILGDEGEKSLLAELKREKLADKIACGEYKLNDRESELYLEIELTNEGVRSVNQVIELCFQMIARIKEIGIPKYLFDDLQKVEMIHYQYQPREDLFSTLQRHADGIVYEELSTYPEQTWLTQKYDPELTQELLNAMTPNKARYYLAAPPSLTKQEPNKEEPWLNVGYALVPIDNQLIEQWTQAKPNPAMDLPPQNRFIPQHLSVIAASSQENKGNIPHPEAILNDERAQVYFLQDNRYHVPEIYWFFDIKTPKVDMGNANKMALADLYAKSVKEALNAISYPATIAGLNFEVKPTKFGIGITITGYGENAELLFKEILKGLKPQTMLSEGQFEIYKDALLREYQNFAKAMPIEQASEVLKSIIFKCYATKKQKAAALQKINLEQFDDFVAHLFDQTYVEGLLSGDMKRQQADSLIQQLFSTLHSNIFPKTKQKKREVIILPKQEGPFSWESITRSQGNAALLAVEYSDFSFKARASQQILMQAITEPFFSTLRTKQQTGYIVYTDEREVEKQLFNLFAVQSNTHSVRDLLARFELFIEGYLQELKHEITPERFKSLKASCLEPLEKPQKNLVDLSELLQKLAFEYQGDFDWISKRIQGIKDLSYDEFLEMAQKMLSRQNRQRIAILLKGVIPKDHLFNYVPLKSIPSLRKQCSYE